MTKIIPKINQIWYDEDSDCYGEIVKITDNLVTMKWDYGQTFTFPIQNLNNMNLMKYCNTPLWNKLEGIDCD